MFLVMDTSYKQERLRLKPLFFFLEQFNLFRIGRKSGTENKIDTAEFISSPRYSPFYWC